MGKLKVKHKWVGLGRVQSFMFYSGSGWVTSLVSRVGSGRENWTHVQRWLSWLSFLSKYRVPKIVSIRMDGWQDERTVRYKTLRLRSVCTGGNIKISLKTYTFCSNLDFGKANHVTVNSSRCLRYKTETHNSRSFRHRVALQRKACMFYRSSLSFLFFCSVFLLFKKTTRSIIAKPEHKTYA